MTSFLFYFLKLPTLEKRGMNLPQEEKVEIPLGNIFPNPSDPPLAGHLPFLKGGALLFSS